MTENQEQDIMDLSETHCYTYKVTMVIQIIAPNKEIADAKLNQDGGYISKRDVEFSYSTHVYGNLEEEKEKTQETEETNK